MINSAEKIKNLPFISQLEMQEVEAIASSMVSVGFAAGETVFLEGEGCKGIYIVETGWLKAVKVSLQGREQVIRFLKPGEMFNEVAFFSNKPNMVTVISLEASQVWLLQGEKLKAVMENSYGVCNMMLTLLSDRVGHMLQMVEDLSFRSVESRLARAILEHAEENVASRRSWSTQAEMASHFGTVPVVLNRELNSLAQKGLIEVARTRISILNEAGLKQIAMLGE